MKIRKILIVRFNALGDVIHTTIAPYAIKLAHPDCEIHYLTTHSTSIMLEYFPYVDKIIRFENNFKETVETIKKEKYDAVLCMNISIQSFKLALALFPLKFIFRSFKGKSWVENYFYTAKKLFKDIKLPDRLCFSNPNQHEHDNILKLLSNRKRPYIVFNPGILYPNPRAGRVWSINKYKILADKLLEKYGGSVFVSGGANEYDYHKTLDNAIILSGKFNIHGLCDLMSLADIVISGDSGPIHIASAYNVKTIALLGSTSPDKIKPYGKNGYFIEPKSKCRYCWKKKCKYIKNDLQYPPCIDSIEVEDVLNLIEKNNLL